MSLGAADTSDNPPFGQSLAAETRGYLTSLREWKQLGKLRPTSHWRSMPEHERGSGFFRSLAWMAACGPWWVSRVTSLESLALYRNRAELIIPGCVIRGREACSAIRLAIHSIEKTSRMRPSTWFLEIVRATSGFMKWPMFKSRAALA